MNLSMFHVHLALGPGKPFNSSFEQAQTRLESLDRLYFEPDGSALWCPHPDEEISATLYDAVGRVQYVDVWGKCQRGTWRRFVTSLAGPADQNDVQILNLDEGVWQDLQTFEHLTWPATSNE